MRSRTEMKQLLRIGWIVAVIAALVPAAAMGAIALEQDDDEAVSENVSEGLAHALETMPPDELVRVIVVTREKPVTTEVTGELEDMEGTVERVFTVTNGYVAELPAGQVMELCYDPEVLHVSQDLPLTLALDVAVPAAGGGGPGGG